jgi:hypothetical protein
MAGGDGGGCSGGREGREGVLATGHHEPQLTTIDGHRLATHFSLYTSHSEWPSDLR